MSSKGPGLYEFLTESELQQYFNAFKKDLKVHNVGQLKFVTEEDLTSLGMSKPEIRRLKKYFQKYCPQTYLSKFRKILLPKKESADSVGVIVPDEGGERQGVRVPSKHIIPADTIVINKELGVGEFGVVQQGVWTNEEGERIQVAIKCLSKDRLQSQPMEFLKEAAIMHTINSEHIVRLYGVVLDTNSLMLVTELAPLRSLLECLKEPSLRVSFPVTSLCHFTVQICDGMCYLESKRLIHRDLAARNILVFSKNKIKISDFGLSRALGVGKDYYQTNFNVNLKLPIAWCAPECINYLRFTSASDVWAFGVTLWEMFSYGFQPWAALTGQQILEAIDEPNFQRLEQPEACPKEYYSIMLKCWQHDPVMRPKFADLINILPDLKPEQVQSVKEAEECINTTPSKRERLQYDVGDIITVLDKRPFSDNPSVWKGVLNNGKTGLFNPANTVAYLGTSIPSNKSSFQRGDGKNAYSSRRRLRPEMISGPQGDLKHTGHVGLDGAYFGDVSFLGDKVQTKLLPNGTEKYHQLPKQIVTPYKPSEDHDQSTTLTRASSDVSDRAPLLKKVGEKGKFGPASEQNWSDTASDDHPESPAWFGTQSNTSGWLSLNHETESQPEKQTDDHEYHEISDEEDSLESKKDRENGIFRSGSFDLGPSLMDEVFRALGGSSVSQGTSSSTTTFPPGALPPILPAQNSSSIIDDETSNVRNELKEMASRFSNKDSAKKKQALVKPISATDGKTLDSAIAMANELASKSMLKLDGSLEGLNGDFDYHSGPPDSPTTPSSPNKNSRFSFKFSSRGSPKPERRHFSAEAASIADIQSSISEEAKEVYNSLVERPSLSCSTVTLESQVNPDYSSSNEPNEGSSMHSNPLRMLRQGITVRPKVRGNKRNVFSTLGRGNGERNSSRLNNSASQQANFDPTTHQTLPRGFKHTKVAPPVKPKPSVISLSHNDDCATSQEGSFSVSDSTSVDSEGSNNPLPLPPRDRSKGYSTPSKTRHQRKYPLIIPGGVANSLLRSGHLSGSSEKNSDSPSPRLLIQHTHNPNLETQGTISTSPSTGSDRSRSSNRDSSNSPSPKVPPAKPPRLFSPSSLDDSFESQVACDMDALDEIPVDPAGLSPVGVAPSYPTIEGFSANDTMSLSTLSDTLGRGSLYQSNDHVSCEDLLDFALDKPNSRRTQGPSHGIDSDEVHLLMKVLKHEINAEECLETLNECKWDVHRALKLLRLRLLVPNSTYSISTARTTMDVFSWDITKASTYLAAKTSLSDEDTTQV